MLEHTGREFGQGANIHRTQGMVVVFDMRIDSLVEKVYELEECLGAFSSSWDWLDNWFNKLEAHQTRVDHQLMEDVLRMRRIQAQ